MKTQEMTLCKNLLVCLMIVSGCSQRQMDMAVEPGRSGCTEAGVALSMEHVTMSAHRIELCYQIRNDSEEEIWFCDDMDADSAIDFETVASRDGETLFIRMRLDMPSGWWCIYTPYGRYRRLASGEVHRGVLAMACPVQEQPVLTSRSAHHRREVKNARFLVLEIGYFSGDDLPGRLLDTLREAAEEHESFEADLSQLRRDRSRLEEELEQLTEAAQRAEVTKTVERLRRQEARFELLGESGWPYLPVGYSDVSESFLWALEDRRSQIDEAANVTTVPYLYGREAGEAEHLLSATVVEVSIPYLPPRYPGDN